MQSGYTRNAFAKELTRRFGDRGNLCWQRHCDDTSVPLRWTRVNQHVLQRLNEYVRTQGFGLAVQPSRVRACMGPHMRVG